jgi:ribonuclease VapC
MILDTSAILAVVFKEPRFEVVLDKIAAADVVAIGAPTAAEAGIVLDARWARWDVGRSYDCARVGGLGGAFRRGSLEQAADAYSRFGRGPHKAALNLGDCL